MLLLSLNFKYYIRELIALNTILNEIMLAESLLTVSTTDLPLCMHNACFIHKFKGLLHRASVFPTFLNVFADSAFNTSITISVFSNFSGWFRLSLGEELCSCHMGKYMCMRDGHHIISYHVF